MQDVDWMYDVLFELSEMAEKADMPNLSKALEYSMDAFEYDEVARDKRRAEAKAATALGYQASVDPVGWGVAANMRVETARRTRVA